jgi:hypothetical protein
MVFSVIPNIFASVDRMIAPSWLPFVDIFFAPVYYTFFVDFLSNPIIKSIKEIRKTEVRN